MKPKSALRPVLSATRFLTARCKALLLIGVCLALPFAVRSQTTAGRILVAKKIITMDPNRPTATAVGIDRGLIVAAGSLAEVTVAMQGRSYSVDRSFASEVIVPGFVEGHSPFQGYGFYSRVPYLGYYDRVDPDSKVQRGSKTLAELLDKLRRAVADEVKATRNAKLPVLAFGADPIFFPLEIPERHFTTRILDQVSSTTPIFLPLLNGHVVACNTPMLELVMQEPGWQNISNSTAVLRYKDTHTPTGELDEIEAATVAFAAFQKKRPLYFPVRGLPALADAAKMAQRAGVTTASELAFGADSPALELTARGMYALATSSPDFPLRVVLGYYAPQLVSNYGADAVKHLKLARATDTNKLRTGPVKVITDGSIQGYTAQLMDGYPPFVEANPIWNVLPEDPLYNLCLPFWRAGIQIAVHVNGDEATQRMLDVLEVLQADYPQVDHRLSLQHNQVSRPEQFARMARLGATVNLFCNHLYYYGDHHRAITLGEQRAAQMDSPAMARAAGVPYAIHSDAPVTPLQPLMAMWCAVNRRTASGESIDDAQASHKISVAEALHAVTLGSAYLLKLEKEIGSIVPGKRADFAVLGQDPYAVPTLDIKDIPVKATVFDGKIFRTK
jgi:predicted amidohydrolase YtcJ